MNSILRRPHVLVLAGIFCLLSWALPGQSDLSKPLPVSPDIKMGKLGNGLTYYIRKNSRPEKRVELRLVVKAGSILEDDDQQGLAHFTEHMGFNGSAHFPKNELVSFLQKMGIEFGADLNANTSFDETIYILPVPVDKKENLEKGLLVLEDWAAGMSFEGSEIDKERGVVLEESRLGKGANDRMNNKIIPKLFEGSKYSVRIPIGKDDILKNFPHDAIRRFYKDWYRPDLMAVIAVGDLDPLDVENRIKAHFEKLKNPAAEKKRIYAEVPERKKSEAVVVTDKEATVSIIRIYYSFKKDTPEIIEGDYRESLVRALFQSMLNMRLQELTQTSEPPFVYGGSSLGLAVHGHEVFSSLAVIGKKGLQPALNALMQEGERARKFGFTEAELERTKKNMLKGIDRAYQERDKTESNDLADELIRNFLEQEPIPGIETEHEYYQKFLPGITVTEVSKYAANVIPTAGHKLVVFTGPEAVDFAIPTSEQLLAMVDQAASSEVTAYEDKAVAAELMATKPIPGKILSETVNTSVGLTELTLSNGVKVLLKPTDFKNDQVIMSAFRFGGQYLFGTEDRYNAEYAAQSVSSMGVGVFSPNDLRKVLAGKAANVSPRIGIVSEGINGQSSANDVEAMLSLTYLYFTQPRVDKELFTSFVSKQQAWYENSLKDPQTVLKDSVLKITYGKHPRGPRIPTQESFSRIDLDRAVDIYNERFGNANGFTFVLVGKIDLATIKPLIATYLGSLPSSNKISTFNDLGVRPVRGVVKKEVRQGSDPKSYIIMQFTGVAPYSTKEQLKLQAAIEVLNIKITETLREEMGDIYGGGAYGALSKYPYENYAVNVSLPCGPENVQKVIKATLQEIAKLQRSGPKQQDLDKVKETWKKQHEESLRDNNYWVRQLQQSVEMGTPVDAALSYLDRVQSLTTKDVKAAAKKYLDSKNYIEVVLNPK